MLKTEVRNLYKQKRKALGNTMMQSFNARVNQQLQHLPYFTKPLYIMGFRPIISLNEPNILPFLQQLTAQIPGTVISFPKVKEDNTIDAYQHDHSTQYTKNAYQIEEPVNSIIIDPKHIDIILIPLLAIDLKGYRVGYGKGMYDQFLTRCKTDILKIGISIFEPIETITNIDSWDIPMNIGITPQNVYKFHHMDHQG